jgi:hypothetical protein
MARLAGPYQWSGVVAKHFPHLSKPMAACLALWSLGMIVARSCSLTGVVWALKPIRKEKFYTLRERLRDLYREAPAKAGRQRCQLDLDTCWAPWLAWVVEGWHNQCSTAWAGDIPRFLFRLDRGEGRGTRGEAGPVFRQKSGPCQPATVNADGRLTASVKPKGPLYRWVPGSAIGTQWQLRAQ